MGKKRKIKKGIESYDEQIEKHKQKIAEYTGTNYALIDYWKKEIERYENEKTKEKRKIEKE